MTFARYYLVRREAREFIGPMQLREFQERLARLEFGLQDEVSGHCGPWVVMDRKEDMTVYYPEIAKIFGEDLPLSWRETTGHAKVISRKDTRKDRKKKLADHKGSRKDFHQYIELRKRQSSSRKLVAAFLVVMSLMVGAWIVLRKDDAPNVAEIASLALKPDPSEFLNTMGLKVIPQASRLARSTKYQTVWLPYLRMYAYFTIGAIDGVSQKILKGDAAVAAPSECSVEFWKRKWKEFAPESVAFLQGKAMARNPWTKMLALDPDWVRRRPAKGWLRPRNYFEGCLMTALTAIRSLNTDLGASSDGVDAMSPDVANLVSMRLQFQIDSINQVQNVQNTDRSSLLGLLSCMESQSSIADLDRCRGAFDPGFKPLLEEKYALAVLRIALLRGSSADDKGAFSRLSVQVQKLSTEDYMSRLDLTPELKLMSYLAASGTAEPALARINEEYSEIKFR